MTVNIKATKCNIIACFKQSINKQKNAKKTIKCFYIAIFVNCGKVDLFLPMKTFPLLILSIVFLVFGLSFQKTVYAQETAVWLAGKARESGVGILWPDMQGTFDLEMSDATGVTIGERPTGGGDTKSIEFSGNQVSVFRSRNPFPSVVEKLKIELEAFIPDDAGTEDSTLLRHGTQWEIRYQRKNMSYLFIVWHSSGVFTQVQVPLKYGKWETITAEYTPEELTLTVDGESATAIPVDVLNQDASPAHLLLGASTSKILDEMIPRLFNGSMANVRITVD